jgi:hypothetical protein
MDMVIQPKKVLAACEALMPHLYHVAVTSADPNKQVPIGYWMHRGCIPFISEGQFESHYWPTLKPIIEELWQNGHQTLFYAEGDWNHHLDKFSQLPDRSIVFHVDKSDLSLVHKKLGHKFCLSGGIPNFILSYGSPEEVRVACKKVIDEVAQDGGFIIDASAIMQDDTKIENLRALTEFTREYGVYSSSDNQMRNSNIPPSPSIKSNLMENSMDALQHESKIEPGICIPWSEKLKEIPNISGDEELVKQIWEDIEGFGNMFIWQCLLSF